MTHVLGYERRRIMSFKQYNLDNPEEAKRYKREKEHKRFVRENKGEEIKPAYETKEDPSDYAKELGENLIGKVIKIDKLRIRKYPEGEILRLINRGDEVRIISDFDDIWYKVELADGLRGFCMKTYLMTFVDEPGLDDKTRRCKCNV